MKILASNQVNAAAGAATTTARFKTYIDLSSVARTIVFQTFGLRYGGNSSV